MSLIWVCFRKALEEAPLTTKSLREAQMKEKMGQVSEGESASRV